MKVITLKKDTLLSELASGCGVSGEEFMRTNDIENAGILPRGMSLLLPSKDRKARQSTEFFLSGKTYEAGIVPSAAVRPSSIFQFENHEPPRETLPLLAVNNTDKEGFLSPALAHELFVDESEVQTLIGKLVSKLECERWGGLLINMEYLFPFDKVPYTDFVRNLEKAVHRSGRWLIVCVPASAVLRPDSRSGAAYDIEALSDISDRIVLMPQEVWNGDIFENCLLQLGRRVPLGKVLAGIKPQGLIRRGEHTSHMGVVAAHNLAIRAKARIHRECDGAEAEFCFMDAAEQSCHVRYTDALWLSGLFRQLRNFGLAGIFCNALHSLCPGGTALFDGEFRAEKLT